MYISRSLKEWLILGWGRKIQGELQASGTKNHRKKTGTCLKGLPWPNLGSFKHQNYGLKEFIVSLPVVILKERQKGMVDGKTGRMLANK